MTIQWAIVTGEYPPQAGGVADYTRLIANGLAESGDEVCVWAPPVPVSALSRVDDSVEVRRLPGNFGPRSLWQLGHELNDRSPTRLLLQYTPHAFGFKAMNLPLVWWLTRRREPLDVMFHEVAFPIKAGQPFKHNVLGRTHHYMARRILNKCQRVFVSCLGWIPLLRRLTKRPINPIWVPVPSTVETVAKPTHVDGVRSAVRLAADSVLVGHFGTYGEVITQFLTPTILELAKLDARAQFVLVGRNGTSYARWLTTNYGLEASRVHATGDATPKQVAAHLAACDVVALPYPDGVSTRRTSAMAALALGCPIVTNSAEATEPIWAESGAVRFAEIPKLAAAALALVRDVREREALGQRARQCYESHFALRHTIEHLRNV